MKKNDFDSIVKKSADYLETLKEELIDFLKDPKFCVDSRKASRYAYKIFIWNMPKTPETSRYFFRNPKFLKEQFEELDKEYKKIKRSKEK